MRTKMINKIFDFIKYLFIFYWKSRPFRAFITLDTLVLVGFSAFRITYDFSADSQSLGVEITQGEYNWALVAVLAIINIPFVIWLINDGLKAKIELISKPKSEVVVGFFFSDKDTEALTPQFEERIISYQLKKKPKPVQPTNPFVGLTSAQAMMAYMADKNIVKPAEVRVVQGKINKSFAPIQFYLQNTGKPSLKCFELTFFFGDDVAEIKRNNKEMCMSSLDLDILTPSSTYIDEKNKRVFLKDKEMLVGGDHIVTKTVFIKPNYPCEKIIVQWCLLADEFQETGSLEIPVKSNLIPQNSNRFVDHYDELKETEIIIGDYIEIID